MRDDASLDTSFRNRLFHLISTRALDMNDQQRFATWDEVEEIGYEMGVDESGRSVLLGMALRFGAPQKLMHEWRSIESVDVLREAVIAWLKAKPRATESPIPSSHLPLMQTGAHAMNDQKRVPTWDDVETLGFARGLAARVKEVRAKLLRIVEDLGASAEQLAEWREIESLDALADAIRPWMRERR